MAIERSPSQQACFWCESLDGCDCENRIECEQAGQIGHFGCGWCIDCDGPMFQCMCFAKKQNHAFQQDKPT